MKTGIELITEERTQQIMKHHRSIQDDAIENKGGKLLWGAKALIDNDYVLFPKEWDENICSHMIHKKQIERLIIAGALIAAEIDRLQATP